MQPADSLASPSFAGLLAALATPTPDPDDGLVDDIAELSYEGALRQRASGDTGSPIDSSAAPACSPERISITEAELQESERRGKSDRVTLRLNRSECLQLRARAAESGLTISAYLRTCILEVESLRAQVKEAVARMRAPEAPDEPQMAQGPPKFGPFAAQRWRAKIFPHRKGIDQAERA